MAMLRIFAQTVASATLALAGTTVAAADQAADLAAVKAATERFADVEAALADGYIPDPSGQCVSAEAEGLPAELGAMGIHYLRPDLLGLTAGQSRVDGTGTHTDFLKPAVLLYEPQADGTLVLVGVENLVFRKAWHDAGNTQAPVFSGVSWNEMADDPKTPMDEAHHFEPHYDLHVWLYRDNPAGTFAPFNPAVSCKNHVKAANKG